MKQKFLFDEIWMLTLNAAFQRANIYRENGLEKIKEIFRQELKAFVCNLSTDYNSPEMDEARHLQNIRSITIFSKKYINILNQGELNFGISQKLLNLYLKYLWCLNWLEIPPPHFPVDRRIQTALKISPPSAWTQMSDENEYLKIIQKAKEMLSNSEFKNLSELELFLFSRKSNVIIKEG